MLKKVFQKDKLLKHVFTLIKGTVLAQIIGIAAQPLLRRVFSPEDFGVFALYIAIVSILAVVATGRYEMAIILPPKKEDANELFKLSIFLSAIFSLILFIILLFLSNYIVAFILEQKMVNIEHEWQVSWLKYTVLLTPLGVFGMSLFNTINYWFTRNERYSKIVRGRIFNSSTNVSASLSLGYGGFSSIGLVFGYLFGLFISSIYFLKLKREQRIDGSKSSRKMMMKDYIDFPTKSLLSGLLNILASQLPIIIIGSLYGVAILALYELIIRILNVPITMVGKSVSQVFFQKISEDVKNGNEIGRYVNSFSKKLFLFMLIPMSIIFFFGEPVFSFVFGKEYALSGSLASYFSIFFLVRFVYYAQSPLYIVKRKLNIELRQNLIYLVSQMSALAIGYYYFKDFQTTFILLAASGFLCYLFFVISLLKLANNK